MKIFKKVSAILLCGALAIGALSAAGCAKEKPYDPDNFISAEEAQAMGEPYKIVKEPITLTVFVPISASNPHYSEMASIQKLSEITNIKFDFIEASVSAYTTLRTAAWQNKNDLPDLFLFNNPVSEQVTNYRYGAMYAWNDDSLTVRGVQVGNLIEGYMPNYKALLESNFGHEEEISALSVAMMDDGKMYSLVCCNDIPRDMTYKMYINQQWIDNLNEDYGLGLPDARDIRTLDEYVTVLRAFKNYDANRNDKADDEIPVTAQSLFLLRNFVLAAFGYVSNGIEIEADGNSFVYVPATDEYREYLRFMNGLYEEKILDNSTFEKTTGSSLAGDGYQGKLGSFPDAGAYLTVGEELDEQYTSFGPLRSAGYDGELLQYGIKTMFQATGAVIPTGTPYVREIARLLDILYSDYGVALMAQGVEGVHWSWDDEEKTSWTFHVPDTWKDTSEQYRATISPSVGTGCALYIPYEFDKKQNDATLRRINEEAEIYQDYIKIPVPENIRLDPDGYNRAALITASLDAYIKSTESNFIKGVTDVDSDQEWNSYLSDLKGYNYEELVEIYNAALR